MPAVGMRSPAGRTGWFLSERGPAGRTHAMVADTNAL